MNRETIQSCIAGDQAAFRELVDQYAEFAFSATFRILNDEEEAKDIVQESFITVWEKIDQWKPEMNFRNWFYRILVNKCYDSLRKKKRKGWISTDKSDWKLHELDVINEPDKIMDNKEIGGIIKSLTTYLSPKQKIIFVLCDLEDHSHDEVAEITGMHKTSIKSNLNHARRKIGVLLKKYL